VGDLSLRQRRHCESLVALLKRLDAAVIEAAETETCIDEVNAPLEPKPLPPTKPARRSRR
jgi:hypothetical protein